MKIISLLISLYLFTACTTHKNAALNINPNITGKVMSDGNEWMTKNLDLVITGSYCPQNDSVLCAKFGRLYTWEAATEGCKLLGNGWRLPTDEEWTYLVDHYGGLVNESEDGKQAYTKLIDGGNSGFDALLAGNREPDGAFERIHLHGFYWTSTENNTTEAWFFNFAKNRTLINRHTSAKERAVSVRCIR